MDNTVRTTAGKWDIQYNELYDRFFPESSTTQRPSWDAFSSKKEDIIGSIAQKKPDFEMNLRAQSRTISQLFFSIIEYIFDLPKAIVRKVILLPLYPAQSTLVSLFFFQFRRSALEERRIAEAEALATKGFYFRHVVLKVNGTVYSALLAGHKSTIDNGRWVLQATGNGMPGEHVVSTCAESYRQVKCNVLIVNGPQVGASRGTPTAQTIGEAQRAGLLFLEKAIKANSIAIAGLSFGGAAVTPALLEEDFADRRHYVAIRQVAFDSMSNVCATIVRHITGSGMLGACAAWLVRWSGLEIDCAEASERLAQKKIREIIVQAMQVDSNTKAPQKGDFINDMVIPPEATLGYRLAERKMYDNKVFVRGGLCHVDVNGILDATLPELQRAFGS